MLPAWALMSLAGSAPTGRTFPWRSTSPVTATSPGTGFPVRMDTRAARVAAPAEGPSFVTPPPGRCTWMSLRSRSADVVALDEMSARAVGVLLGRSEASDVVDGQVALVARQREAWVISSDVGDPLRLEPDLEVYPVPG